MKKLLAMLMAALMLMSGVALAEPAATDAPALGGRTAEEAYQELIVGSMTALSGHFFTDLWGNNASDIDVRELLHGYGLVNWNAEQGMFSADPSVVSALAAQTDAEGNKTYIVSIAQDLVYCDGTPITARDYVFSILLTAMPAMRAIGAATGGTDYILGAEAYAADEAATLAGVRLLGEHQFSMTVRADRLPFFYELGLLNFKPYPVSVIAPGYAVGDDGEGAYIRDAAGANALENVLPQTVMDMATGYRSHPGVTSGPYKLVSYDAEAKVAKFEINPYFKGLADGQKPQIERLTLKHVTPANAIEALKNGEIDLLNKGTQADVIDAGIALSGAGAVRVSNYPRVGLTMLSFDAEQGPGQSQKVRQAVALGFDRDAFLSEYIKNYGMPVDGYYGMGQWMTRLVSGALTAPVEQPAEGATAEETAAYEAAMAEWGALSIAHLNPYAFDVDAAKALLVEDGWTRGEAGEAYDEAAGGVRYKDGMKLSFNLAVPQGNAAAAAFETVLKAPLAGIGVELTITQVPLDQLLAQYYRQQPREFNLFYLGTNFTSVFDPSYAYAPEGTLNATGLKDEQLWQLAMDMHKTEQGDVLGYLKKWVAFQTRWNELLPAVPVYSNVYFDLFVPRLQNYQANAYATWTQAVVYAYLSDAAPEAPAGDVEELILSNR
ncbi:MAG: ABC transporter substrate-binding protein [Eubacteriales bacterium]|nr:ABC transporter substrate-binding protein [Christensenellaceae bacterium]MEA5065006.1 ABC transporter substrate-binding protein [Eubacteriales bacterium]